MSMIGNDNFRPGLKPPPPIKNTGWLSSNMAQLMVFLNGLILTVTAYATLSVFISEIINESLVNSTEDIQTRIAYYLDDIEESFSTAGAFISLAQEAEKENMLETAYQSIPNVEIFEQFYYVQFSEEGEAVEVKTLLGYKVDGRKSILKEILQRQEAGQSREALMSGLGRQNTALVSETFGLESRMVALLKPYGQKRGVIALFDLQKAIDEPWLKKNEALSRLLVVDRASGNSLLKVSNVGANKNGNGKAAFEKTFQSSLGGALVDVSISLDMSKRESFLQKIPFLMLLFGSTLTLIGTLYVRNNQKQSLRLANMNKELAQKNFELNTQVNEREKLNQAIQKSERENRAVIDSVSDIIFETSADGEILFLNETWKKVTGFAIENSLSRTLFDMLYPQDQAEQQKNFEQLVKGHKQSYRAFTRLRTSDGTFRAVEMAVSMMRQDGNKNLRIVGTFTDVEERRRAERALSEAEKKYRTIVENAAGGIYQTTPDGQFLSANRSMARILGYEAPEEILRDVRNANTHIYVDAEGRSKFLNELAKTQETRNMEARVYCKNEEIIWVNENVRSVFDEEGNLLYFEGSMEDITKRKEAEIALREAKVESDLSSRAKSEFLANMSHELRTPLNAIIGFSEIIKNEAFGPVGRKEYWEYARDIYTSGKKLLNVINEILDVSRIEAGERQINEGIVDLNKTVKIALELMGPKIQEGGMVVNNLIGPDAPKVIGETHAIKQMLLNLLSNAVKFTPNGGRISVDTDMDSSGNLRVSITDTGVGLNENEIKKALSPFGQVNTEMSRNDSGTGLGLTLVNALIRLHGGSLELFSQKGIGTTATLVFPAKRVSTYFVETEENAPNEFARREDVSEPTEDITS